MNIGLLIAGGKGERMGQDIPKQFLHIENKPIIIYTLEAFQEHPSIDAILVVCVDGWHDILRAYANQYGITKLKWIVSGGNTGQESIYNGLNTLSGICGDNDIVLIHDAIRPMVSKDIISDCIAKSTIYGSAITTIPCAEAILVSDDGFTSSKSANRETLKRTQTPQGFKFEKIMQAHKKAADLGITNSVASCTLMIEIGDSVYFSQGSEKNIKLTTVEDIEIFKALLNTGKDTYLKG